MNFCGKLFDNNNIDIRFKLFHFHQIIFFFILIFVENYQNMIKIIY